MEELSNMLDELLDLEEGLSDWEIDFIEKLSNWDGNFTTGQSKMLKSLYKEKL